jgi:L,D-peptidoglycan transpeptidase YkuD (ErfK/YbiS/YcfS/YnhG family)
MTDLSESAVAALTAMSPFPHDLPTRRRSLILLPMLRTLFILLLLAFSSSAEDHLDPSVTQLIVGIAPTWDSMHGHLQRFEKVHGAWQPAGPAVPVLFGKHGLAWGRGALVGQGGGPQKVERDNRAPAGVFKIGTIYTYDQSLPQGADFPFHTVGPGDAWVDDLHSRYYNQHVVIDPRNPPDWFQKQKMRHGDFAYRWLVEIRHNADPPVPGFGSAIFFHIRRGPDRPSAGCTTMAENNLVSLIQWLRAPANPMYVCLPQAEYMSLWKTWDLPSPAVARELLGRVQRMTKAN